MSEITKVRIGMTSARELELEMDDGSDIGKALEKALDKGDDIFWLTDSKGQRHGMLLDKIAFVEIDTPEERAVGFG